jgi:hypothetical protein
MRPQNPQSRLISQPSRISVKKESLNTASTGQDGNVEKPRRFVVGVSFPGEVRKRVAAIARHLADALGRNRLLYDKFHEAEFARPNLDVYLQSLYHNEVTLNVVFLCEAYARKEWCGLEWRAIRDLIKRRRSEIMFLRLDDGDVAGVFSIDGYVDIRERGDDEGLRPDHGAPAATTTFGCRDCVSRGRPAAERRRKAAQWPFRVVRPCHEQG